MEPFKNLYSTKSLGQMADHLQAAYPKFPKKDFVRKATAGFKALEMKARVVQIADAMELYLPGPYRKNLKIIEKALAPVGGTSDQGLEGFILWPVTYYIESRGLDDFDPSLKALKSITKRFTSEFGIRPFLEAYPEKVYPLFQEWTRDKCEHVRRWVSEGTRPNLPWGRKISHIESQFQNNLKILEALKADPSLYVRKSVANHLNDISWYQPQLVIKTLKSWRSLNTPEMAWQEKQALRTLVKKGNPQALRLMGFDPKASVEVRNLKASPGKIQEGESFLLEFKIINTGLKAQSFMVDYVIDFLKANGSHSPKVFKLKNVRLKPKESICLEKVVKFRKVTTRVHYPGKQHIAIQLNGIRRGNTSFVLV